jgi:hypothetical protein
MVEQALSPRVHNREAGWVVVNASNAGPRAGSDQQMRCRRALGSVMA